MNLHSRIILVLVFMALLSCASLGQTKQQRNVVVNGLDLSDTEATKFWPVYDQYQAEYKKIGDTKVALIKEYAQNWGSVTDAQALQYWQRSQDIEQSVLQLRQKYVPIVGNVLPGKKTVTFFQIDRRIALLRLNPSLVSALA